mmetsp:Transcript_15807/g.31897  ORF Transcript_15807/g.31897 Transcript_15807/m.31897 type:complete len:249 (+) Transcript_15807:34-780(+)
MTAATATLLHDPWSRHHNHYSPTEASALLDLLAVDYLVDSHRAPPKEHLLLQDLWKVDNQFRRFDDYENNDARVHKDTFLDLIATDQEVDRANHSKEKMPERHYTSSKALHDPYRPKNGNDSIDLWTGVYAANNDGAKGSSHRELLRDNKVMMHLLAMDESVDDHKKWTKDVESDEYALIGDLHEVDLEVGAAKSRALFLEDLQGLLDVDHFVDGKKMSETQEKNGKRAIFSVKEKYKAKVSDKYSAK